MAGSVGSRPENEDCTESENSCTPLWKPGRTGAKIEGFGRRASALIFEVFRKLLYFRLLTNSLNSVSELVRSTILFFKNSGGPPGKVQGGKQNVVTWTLKCH